MTASTGMFAPAEGMTYLDSATYGLAPAPAIAAMTQALTGWQDGTAHWIDDFDSVAEHGRATFAHLVGVPIDDVALVPSASVGVGTVAASLEVTDQLLVPDDEFTSLLFPLLVAERSGVGVTQVPYEQLVDHIVPGVTLVACSLVQMQTGRVAALEAILDRAAEVGARVLVDGTHGLPFVGLSGLLARADYIVCAGYKHLLCPRGVSFFVVRADRQEQLSPWNANWRSTDGFYQRYFGGPLTLVDTAGRFDVSPAWLPWIGGAESLELLCGWSADGELERASDLARMIAEELDVPWGGASLVSVSVDDLEATSAALTSANIKAGVRGGRVRLSTHVYNTPADVDLVSRVLGPFVARPSAPQ